MSNMGESDTSENQFTQTDLSLLNYASNVNPTKQGKVKLKTSIWSILFGEKRCKHCSEKKHDCNCKRKKKTKNKATQSEINLKNRCEQSKVSTASISTSKETQICENMKNCVPPEDRGGLGFHFYFCMDNPKQTNLKSKRIKQKSEDFEEIRNYDTCQTTNLNKDDLSCDEGLKVTILCDSTENVPEESKSQQTKREKQSDRTVNSSYSETSLSRKTPPSMPSRRPEALYQVQNVALDFENQTSGIHRNEIKNKVQFEENSDKRVLTEVSKQYKESDHEKERCDNATIPRYPKNLESIVQSFSTKPVTLPKYEHPGNKRISFFNGTTATDQDNDEIILKEYEAYKKASKVRKSVTKGIPISVRNSSMTLWHQRQTMLDSNIYVILKKLNQIEEKIAELEGKGDSDNIMMGISCDKRQSRVAITFKKQGDKGKPREKAGWSKHTSKEKENLPKTVEVKSQKECVIINTPGEIKVVKERNSGSSVKNVVNSSGIDAHTLGCSLRTIKCISPKILVECPSNKQNCRSLGNESGNQWRRVSEELKISKPDVTSCSVFL
uniref:Uncharacterized protein n=1 Tax=Graphocephala atropunctata TaxID=36148 RepID=A0A1B6KCX4_9HEMI